MTNNKSLFPFPTLDFGIHSFLGISDLVIADEGGAS